MTTPIPAVMRASPPILFWSGVGGGLATAVRRAIRPISVAGPTAVTRTRPCPRVIAVPANTIADGSAEPHQRAQPARCSSRQGQIRRSTGLRLPKAFSGTSRPSAGTRPPSRTTRRSPWTTSSAGMTPPLDTGSNHGSRGFDLAHGNNRSLRAELLEKAQCSIEEDDRRDDAGVQALADGSRDGSRDNQKGDQRVLDLADRDLSVGWATSALQGVRAPAEGSMNLPARSGRPPSRPRSGGRPLYGESMSGSPVGQARLRAVLFRSPRTSSREAQARHGRALKNRELRRPDVTAARPLKASKMMQQSKATAQSFQDPNHSRFGVPCASQTMSQTKVAIRASRLSHE